MLSTNRCVEDFTSLAVPDDDRQVRTIESCLRLHIQLCPPEMVGFHNTLEKFFRKSFAEEIQRLDLDLRAPSRPRDISLVSPRSGTRPLPNPQGQT